MIRLARGRAQQVGQRRPRQQERAHVVQVHEARHGVGRRVERASRGSRRRRWRRRCRGCRRSATVSSMARVDVIVGGDVADDRVGAAAGRADALGHRLEPIAAAAPAASTRAALRAPAPRPSPPRCPPTRRSPARRGPASPPSAHSLSLGLTALAHGAACTGRRDRPRYSGYAIPRSRVPGAPPAWLVSVLSLVGRAAAAGPARRAHRRPVGARAAAAQHPQLTFGGENAEAYFSPDGKQLIFQSTRDGGGCDQHVRDERRRHRRAPRVVGRGAHDLRLLHAGREARSLRQHARRRRRRARRGRPTRAATSGRSTTATTSTWRTPTAAA